MAGYKVWISGTPAPHPWSVVEDRRTTAYPASSSDCTQHSCITNVRIQKVGGCVLGANVLSCGEWGVGNAVVYPSAAWEWHFYNTFILSAMWPKTGCSSYSYRNLEWPQLTSTLFPNESLHKACLPAPAQRGGPCALCTSGRPTEVPRPLSFRHCLPLRQPSLATLAHSAPHFPAPGPVSSVCTYIFSRIPGALRTAGGWGYHLVRHKIPLFKPEQFNCYLNYTSGSVLPWVLKEILFWKHWSLYNLSCACLVRSCLIVLLKNNLNRVDSLFSN